MDSETISRIRSAEQSSAVSRRPGSGRRGPGFTFSVLEHEAKSESKDLEDVEFSALDPEVGAILTQVTPAACGQVAITVRRILRK